MKPKEIRDELIRQNEAGLSGNLYYDTQISFAYNSNRMEGSTITEDETASIFDIGSLLFQMRKRSMLLILSKQATISAYSTICLIHLMKLLMKV